MDRRGLTLAITTMFLAACSVVPKAPAPAPPPPEQPDFGALPDDDGRHRIALLVPMSGTNGDVGKSIANATTMAILDANASNLRITTYDTALGAAQAATKAMNDGNRLILGPLLGSNTAAVASVARPRKVPMISFSNDVSSAARDVFVMGHVPNQSIERTVSYARERGYKRIAALIPNGEYGERVEDALKATIAEGGISLVAIHHFDRGGSTIASAARGLAEQGGFDAVLIAEGARLSLLAASQFTGSKPRILGTELWSGESSIAGASQLQGAWFSAVSDARYRSFSDRYKNRFGSSPYRISTLGYDAVLLALKVAKTWKPGTTFPTDVLLDKGGFIGIDGPFRFRADGVGERAMEVREVRSGGITVVSGAPSRFED